MGSFQIEDMGKESREVKVIFEEFEELVFGGYKVIGVPEMIEGLFHVLECHGGIGLEEFE